jgi:hypothetical protein
LPSEAKINRKTNTNGSFVNKENGLFLGLLFEMVGTPDAIGGSPDQRNPDGGLFSRPIPQRQPHVVNLNGVRRYRCHVPSKIAVTRLPQSSVRFTSRFRT